MANGDSTGRARGVGRYLPAVAWLGSYQVRWLQRDLIAGLVVWAILIPEGMAYAQLAGLPATALCYAAPGR
jgi:sulfate permease, SulP family